MTRTTQFVFLLLCITLAIDFGISDDDEHECTCETHILRDDLSKKAYYEHEIDDFDDIDNNCDSESVKKCVKICLKEYGKMTNNFDLTEVVEGHHYRNFGQYMCDQVGHQKSFSHKQAGMDVTLKCYKSLNDGTGAYVELKTRVGTNLRTKYDFSCEHGHFKLGDKVEEPTPEPRPTTMPTTEAALSTQSYFTCCGE